MQIILTQDVSNLGKAGELVSVKLQAGVVATLKFWVVGKEK